MDVSHVIIIIMIMVTLGVIIKVMIIAYLSYIALCSRHFKANNVQRRVKKAVIDDRSIG